MSEKTEQPIEQHPDYLPEPGFFDEADDEPGNDESAPVAVEGDDVAGGPGDVGDDEETE